MTMQRRSVALGAVVALGSALAGAWWATRRGRPSQAEQRLWAARFATPEGATLAMDAFRGRPLVLNFWASWCAPCVREMPALDRFQREFASAGWQVVGLAIDRAEPVKAFLARTPVAFPIGLAGLEGAELARELGNDRGGLPFTAVFERGGRQVEQHLGETRFEQLAAWAR
jgi:thiol-disulfide isomerase/thioredoxin